MQQSLTLISFLGRGSRDRKNNDSYRTVKYRFKDETLVSIVKRLENYYGVNIRLAHDSLRNIRYTGTFSLDQGIQEVLDIINSEKQFTFTKDGKDILISARSK